MHSKIFLVCGLLFLITACSQSTDTHSTAHSHHANSGERQWPPELEGMTNQQSLPATSRTRARNTVLAAARSALLNNPEVREALGPVVSEYNASLGDSKGDATATFVFYNYSSDKTVEVALMRDGSIQLESFDATQFQPAENADEIETALNLAKVTLESGGYMTAGLQGTAMLAYPSTNETQSLTDTFYPQRVLYVTFGSGDGELPEYSALVNLSAGTVSDFGTIR